MLAKCANPACSTPLVYLREGKIFTMECSLDSKIRPEGPVLAKPKPARKIEHFWLCGPCSAQMTITWDQQCGMQVVPVPRTIRRAFAAAS